MLFKHEEHSDNTNSFYFRFGNKCTIPKYQSLRLEKESEKIKPLQIIVETKEQKKQIEEFLDSID